MSHFRIIVDNLAKYGYSVTFFSTTTDEINYDSQSSSPWSVPQPFLVLVSWGLLLLLVLWIEVMAQRGYLSDRATLIIQSIISMVNVIGSCCWVWFSKCHPAWGILYLLESVIIWMKLISYVHCNRYLPSLLRPSL
jgi:glucan phosphoethanolaminetransferase (alkaline phosphatase superfamily)